MTVTSHNANVHTMGKTEAERKAAERTRRRAAGFQPKEIWVHPLDWPVVKRLLDRLAKRRERK